MFCIKNNGHFVQKKRKHSIVINNINYYITVRYSDIVVNIVLKLTMTRNIFKKFRLYNSS